jgi:fructokinase
MMGETMEDSVFGGIEGGGTKFNCVLGTGPDDVLAVATFPTADPETTLHAVVDFFQKAGAGRNLAAVGMASFGPIDLDVASPTYGYITSTPKAGWQQFNIVGALRERLGVTIGFDTDVNAAALAEHRWGSARGVDPVVYLTVGTGIGGGMYVNGAPLHGLIHPEMGHLVMPAVAGDDFPGVCPFHGRCLEGVASGPALAARAGKPAQELDPDDPLWDLEALYLATAVVDILYTVSPRRVVLGGGVMAQRHLFPRIHARVMALIDGYLPHPAVTAAGIAAYVVPPELGPRCGMLGAIELARRAVAWATPVQPRSPS